MHISVEIVPRSIEHIENELKTIQTSLHQVNTINIPDLLRFKVRSWHGTQLAKASYSHVIPHIRAIDFDLKAPLPFVDALIEQAVSSVLIVSGDPPTGLQSVVHPNKSIDLIRELKHQLPHLKVYAAIDPYRQGFQDEYRYAMEKLEAGASGFFTQPFFDLRLMQIYADLLPDAEIFWGVSPVLNERSKSYWETTNRAIFPNHFDLSLAWNRAFAAEALAFARSEQHHIYYMPIQVNLHDYLSGIL